MRILLSLTILLTSTFTYSANYTIKDLEVLYKLKSYKEYLDHARDIRPTKRSKKWKQMTLIAATEYVDTLSKGLHISEENFNYIETLSSMPVLRNDGVFKLRRTQYALKYFQSCKLTEKKCRQKFLRFTRVKTGHEDLDYKLYKLSSNDLDLKEKILHRITKSNVSEIYCSKPDIQQDILSIINSKTNLSSPIAKFNSTVFSIANKDCVKALIPSLIKRISKRTDNMENETLVRLLVSTKLLTNEQEDYLLVSYLLNGPIVGEVFNLSWNRLSKLEQNYQRREILLEKLLDRDHLLGNIFSHADKKKRSIITKEFSKKFPEYLNAYVNLCVSYYQGKGSFPFGNPTPSCSELMKSTKNTTIVSDYIRLKYSAAKKFK